MQSVTNTISVETKISKDTEGEDYVSEVVLKGVAQLHPETVRDLCQEAIDATYGSVNHHRIAVFTHEDWVNMRRDEPEQIVVRVHTY